MAYDYQKGRALVFTESGLNTLLRIRDNAAVCLKKSGAARVQEIMAGITGDSWEMLACIDYLAERGDLREITQAGDTPGQLRVFVTGEGPS
jgi:uncharacterized metal-binding protein